MKWPCPCCGHQTLPRGPGDYELCPVCFWEDDGAQLRWPQSADGANGVSLQEAQRTYQRLGAMDEVFRDKVRPARRGESLDPGWRPFDPARDWTNPDLDGPRWPKNPEALYWWRPTYWNGDPDALAAAPAEPRSDDRLVERLRREVPEVHQAIEALEWQFGSAAPFAVFAQAAELAIGAYRAGNSELGNRIVRVMNGGLVDDETHTENGVVIAFLENEGWHAPELQAAIDSWPAEIRGEVRRQQAWRARADTEALSFANPKANEAHLPEAVLAELDAMATQPWWRWRHPVRYLRIRRLRHIRMAG